MSSEAEKTGVYQVTQAQLENLVSRLPARSMKTWLTIRIITGCSYVEARALAEKHGRSPEYIAACRAQGELNNGSVVG